MIAKQPRPKKCKNPACGMSFPPRRLGQAVCSPACGLAIKDVNQDKAKKAIAQRVRRELKVRKEKLKSRADYIREAQIEFNTYIRLRDKDEPCICCGSYGPGEDWLTGGKWDAGHFLGRGAYPELRFDEDNCHKQLKSCNGGSGKYAAKGRTVAQGYRERLIQKIGQERVDRLEGPHEARRYTIEELKGIKALYRAKAKQLKEAA
ncbi:recombination protein NinG [Pseudomonas auratipiscis]|uniref:Recombination protein NinG n=1 Tax=Pseudomonas auratipiscis TaxID=3115853 RepID=A0AB35X1E3_9PSED|nr:MULTISPECIES: recombination protein NinG [unclassified Pseudomonas]MEE1869060.1 recombination protein NinG [Pseudomonas sp. 120P]MEE1959707.1 recombination protein NinG [Pseudomonas sp. 119P]